MTAFRLLVSAAHGLVVRQPVRLVYDPGALVTLTAVAADGYRFDAWSGHVPPGGETDNPLTITMNADKTVTVSFRSAASRAGRWMMYRRLLPGAGSFAVGLSSGVG